MLVASQKMLDEYIEVIQRIDTKSRITEQWALFIREHAYIIKDVNLVQISRDPDDDVFINAAVVGNADSLITGDKDLLSIREQSPVKILTPVEFIRLLRLSGK